MAFEDAPCARAGSQLLLRCDALCQAVKDGPSAVPLCMLAFKVPGGGMPPILDFITVFKSVIFTGLQLAREPLDVSVCEDHLRIVKGWTRASAAMMIALAVSEALGDVQLDDPSVMQQLEPLQPVLDHVWFVPAVVCCPPLWQRALLRTRCGNLWVGLE